MDETTFDKLGRAELTHIEEVLDDVDPDDVDVMSSDGVLKLTLRDGVRVVINTHRAARQIWMAAIASAWKFNPPESGEAPGWRTDGDQELRSTLSSLIKERIGVEVAF